MGKRCVGKCCGEGREVLGRSVVGKCVCGEVLW